jgi:hypothetical protein
MTETSKRATVSRSRFVQVPSEFLTLLAKNKEYAWVWMVLWEKAGASKEAWISVAGLIDACKMNIHTIKSALKWLVDNGYVKRISRPGEVSHYELSLERRWAKDEDESPERCIPGAPKSPRAPSSLGLPEAPPTWGSQEPHEPQRTKTSDITPLSPRTPSSTDDRRQTPPEASVRRSEPLRLPAHAEPFRAALEGWLEQSRKKHRNKKRQLSPNDLRGINAAHELGVLAEYAELASESAWMSLGFSGHIDLLQKLQRDQKFHSGATKKQIQEISDEAFM